MRTLLVCLILTACSAGKPVVVDPLEVEVSRAVVVDDKLEVEARINAVTDVEVEQVEVVLSGLTAGESVSTNSSSLSGFITEPVLPAGESALVSLSLPASDFDEFQVTANWGTKHKTSEVFGTGVRLENLQVEELRKDCSGVVCERIVKVSGEITNSSIKAEPRVQLGLGVLWVKDGAVIPKVKKALPGEQVLEVGSLGPRERKEFVVELDKSLPVLPGGRFEPVVRVVQR